VLSVSTLVAWLPMRRSLVNIGRRRVPGMRRQPSSSLLDLDLALGLDSLRLFRRGDLQHALVEARLKLVLIDGLRKPEAALEGAEMDASCQAVWSKEAGPPSSCSICRQSGNG
jgi:hypothetical protein